MLMLGSTKLDDMVYIAVPLLYHWVYNLPCPGFKQCWHVVWLTWLQVELLFNQPLLCGCQALQQCQFFVLSQCISQ